MRHMYRYIITLFLLTSLMASCSSKIDLLTDDISDENVVVSFHISGSSISESTKSTRTADAITSYENHIDLSQTKLLFKVDGTSLTLKNVHFFRSDKEKDVYQVIASIVLPPEYLDREKNYRLEIFANCGANSAYDENLIYDFNKDEYIPTASSRKLIPMWGVTTKPLTLKLGKRSDMGEIHLLRSLSKIEFNLNEQLLKDYSFVGITLNTYNTNGYCLPADSKNLSATVSSPAETYIPSDVGTLTNIPFHMDGYKMYIYIPEYLNTSNLNFNIQIRNKNLNTNEMYSMKFNYANNNQLENVIRNHIYCYTITSLKDLEELICSYTISEWIHKDTDVEVGDVHWLWVRDKILYMNNVGSISTLFDTSASDLVVSVQDVMIYTMNEPWPTGNAGITCVFKGSKHGDFIITSPIPDNYVGKEFTVTISSKIANKTETIKVYQFPPLYVSKETSGVNWSDGNSQSNKSMYVFTALLPDLSTLPYPDDRNYTLSDNKWKKGREYTDFLRTDAAYGYPRTSITKSPFGGFWSSCVNTATNSSKWYPAGINLLTTDPSEVNQELISPRFQLASQAGMTKPTSSYTDEWGTDIPEDRWISLKIFCERYREFTDNKVDYGPGAWRAPTKAEVYLIDVLQNIKKCSVKKILEGGAYFSGDEKINVMMDPRVNGSIIDRGAIRCVRDIK